ncbi:MAG: hypothetical protein ACRDQA_29140 [Nocardioidaceae bacterium]
MIVLGCVLLAVAAIVTIAALWRGGGPARLDMHWFDINTNVAVTFIAGAVCLLLALIGLWLLLKGLRRAHRRRGEMKALRDRAERSERARRDDLAGNRAPEAAPPTRKLGEQTTQAQRQDADDYFDSTPRDD